MPDQLEEFARETIAELLRRLPAEERLKGLPAEDLLSALSPEMREAVARRLRGNGSGSESG